MQSLMPAGGCDRQPGASSQQAPRPWGHYFIPFTLLISIYGTDRSNILKYVKNGIEHSNGYLIRTNCISNS